MITATKKWTTRPKTIFLFICVLLWDFLLFFVFFAGRLDFRFLLFVTHTMNNKKFIHTNNKTVLNTHTHVHSRTVSWLHKKTKNTQNCLLKQQFFYDCIEDTAVELLLLLCWLNFLFFFLGARFMFYSMLVQHVTDSF